MCQYDWFPQGLTMTDVDNDGRLDVYEAFWYDNNHTCFGSQQQLYRGNGDGTFVTMTQDAGLELDNFDGQPMSSLTQQAAQEFIAGQELAPGHQGIDGLRPERRRLPRADRELVRPAVEHALPEQRRRDVLHRDRRRTRATPGTTTATITTTSTSSATAATPATRPTPIARASPGPQIQCPAPLSQNWDPATREVAANLNGNGFTTVCRDMFGSGKNDLYTANIKHWWDGQSIDTSQSAPEHGRRRRASASTASTTPPTD